MGKNITSAVVEYDKILSTLIDKGVENLRKYKETRAEAIKITSLKVSGWPYKEDGNILKPDPAVKTIGDLFAYVFHNPEGGEKWEPNISQVGASTYAEYISDIKGKNAGDATIGEKYKILSDTYRKAPEYLAAMKNRGGGQYWFDFFMYFMYKLMKNQGPWEKEKIDWPIKTTEKKVSDLSKLEYFDNFVYFGVNSDIHTPMVDLLNTLDLISADGLPLIYQATLEAGDAYTGKYTSEIDKKYAESGKYSLIDYLQIETKPTITTLPPVLSPTNSASVKINADFKFNVEKENIFLCADAAIGELTIIKKEAQDSLTVDPAFAPSQEEQIDEEYAEIEFPGEEEQETIFVTSKYEGAPMSGNSYEETKVVDLVTGDDADFWSLMAICACEDGDPQGRADVAQSIYNRVLAGIYGGKSIKKVVCASGQYEPAFDKNKRPAISYYWKIINDKKTAISAVAYAKGIDEISALNALQATYGALSDAKYQTAAREWVGQRCDFLGAGLGKRWFKKTTGEWQPYMSSTEPRRRNEKDNIFANVVGPGAWKWGLNGNIASVPTFFAKYRNDMFGAIA